MKATFDVSEVDDLIDAVDDLPGALDDELDDAADDIGVYIVGEAGRGAPVDTGRLANDLSHLVEEIAAAIVSIKIGSNLDYAEPMERGTDPFFPPPDELRGWAHRVLGDEDLAFVVARSISETGLDERAYIKEAIDDADGFILKRAETAVVRAFRSVGLA